jgi:hypothetical protein
MPKLMSTAIYYAFGDDSSGTETTQIGGTNVTTDQILGRLMMCQTKSMSPSLAQSRQKCVRTESNAYALDIKSSGFVHR